MDSIISTIGMFLVNLLFGISLYHFLAVFVKILPQKFFRPNYFLYKIHDYEARLWQILRVGKWKNKLPKGGLLIGFSKQSSPISLTYESVCKLIDESCRAEFAHSIIGIFGFTSILFASFLKESTGFILLFSIISVINFLLQIAFIILERYNRPRLIKLRQRFFPIRT